METIDKVIASHKKRCKGANKKGEPVLDKAEVIVINVYESGKSVVVGCRYCESGWVVPRCNPELKGIDCEDNFGVCFNYLK